MSHVSRRYSSRIATGLLLLAAAAWPASRARAQAFNIDFDTSGPASPPSAAFGAASGQTGVWTRIIHTSSSVTQALTTTSGELSAATLRVSGQEVQGIQGFNVIGNTGDHAALMDDGVLAWATNCWPYGVYVQATITGLSNGTYNVYTYATMPDTFPSDSSVDVYPPAQPPVPLVGAPTADTFAPGITHAVHQATVTNGSLFISVWATNIQLGLMLNGIQIVPIQIDDCTITQEPQAQTSFKDDTVVFSASFTGNTRLYQWLRDGVPLVNGRGISGATTTTLTMTRVHPEDNGVYSLRYACGGFVRTTQGAALTVTDCPSDVNRDGELTIGDIFGFLARWFSGCP